MMSSCPKSPVGGAAVMLTAALLAVASACSGEQKEPPSAARITPSATPDGGPASASPSTASPGTASPGGAASPSAPGTPAAPPTSRPGAPGPTPTDPDRRGDPVRGYRTLTGVVESSGQCPVLRVGTERWALMGAAAAQLAPGRQVEVRGTVAPAPRGCLATRGLRVSQVRPR